MKIISFLRKIFIDWRLLVVIVLAVGFFFGTSSYNYFIQKNTEKAGIGMKWSSPDETANYIFSKLYAEEGRFYIFEKNNVFVKEIIHPRSFKSVSGYLMPMSFLGMPFLYGSIAKILGFKVLPFLTPFFAAFGIILYYFFVREIFGRNSALISAALLSFFPVYVYYTVRSMFHNTLFVVFLLAGFYLLILINKIEKKYLAWFISVVSGFLIGFAIFIRTSEVLWVIPVLLIVWLFNFLKTSPWKIFYFLIGLASSFLIFFYFNTLLYGEVFSGGYPQMKNSIEVVASNSVGIMRSAYQGKTTVLYENMRRAWQTVFQFGFAPKQASRQFYDYWPRLMPWLFIPTFFGLLLFFYNFRKWGRKHYVYLTSLLFLSIFLVVYYGSWKFNDNPDPNQKTIGNSYTRYWLPIYLGLLPFLAILIGRLTNIKIKKIESPKLNNETLSWFVRFFVLSLFSFISLDYVLYGSDEGLIKTYKNQIAAKDEAAAVLNITERNATIITQYHDKLFFPERKVLVGVFNDDNMNREYAKLLKFGPVYYYNFTLPSSSVNYLNDKKFKQYGYHIKGVMRINKTMSLYRLEKN